MKTALLAEHIAGYRSEGFVVIEDFLDDEELDLWRELIATAVEQHPDAPFGPPDDAIEAAEMPESDKAQLRYYRRVFTQRVNLFQRDDRVRQLVLDPRIGQMAAALAGLPSVRLAHDQALFKPPWGNPTAVHLDVPYWSFTSRDALSLWIALDDVDESNGCLHFWPGTQLEESYKNVAIGSDLGALFDVYPHWAAIAPVAAPMQAGSASFHNGLVAHGAGANLTAQVRRAMTMQYAPGDATFNGQANVLPPEYVATLRVGDPLNDESLTPLVWPVQDSQSR